MLSGIQNQLFLCIINGCFNCGTLVHLIRTDSRLPFSYLLLLFFPISNIDAHAHTHTSCLFSYLLHECRLFGSKQGTKKEAGTLFTFLVVLIMYALHFLVWRDCSGWYLDKVLQFRFVVTGSEDQRRHTGGGGFVVIGGGGR